MNNSPSRDVTNPKTAYLFPGQGSQQVGMGKDLYENSPVDSRIFDEADNALGRSLTGLMFEGPVEDLNLTINTQPAILTASLACLSAIQELAGPDVIPKPNYTAGHSLGEYSALFAAGGISFQDVVHLVQNRAKFMAEAVPAGSGLVAVVLGLASDEVKQACEEAQVEGIVSAANFNAPGQVVIAGEKAAVERLSLIHI